MRRTRPPLAAPSLRLLLATAALALAGACGGTPTDSSGLGSLEITASTTGEDLDPDGYTVVLDGDETRALGVDETITSRDVPAGRYVLELTDVAGNCQVEGQNPRTVRVSGGGTASTTFEVTCSGVPGDLEVSASTSGEDQDPDGYTVTVDPGTEEERTGTIDDPNGSTLFTGLTDGEHTVELDGSTVANNCSFEEGEENPRSVAVSQGDTVSTTFAITCSGAVGDLEVTTATSGEDQDPDGYEVVIDDTQSDSIGPDDDVTFDGLAAGEHEVRLTDESVAANCDVDGDNPRTVTVPNGGDATVDFDVECEEALGDLDVTASTTGDDQDDGYDVAVTDLESGVTRSRSLDPDTTVTFGNLQTGEGGRDHEVELDPSSVADNCTVDSPNPDTVTVPNGGTASKTFDVSCDDIPGGLEVTATTTGEEEDLDPDGYDVQVDPDAGGPVQTIGDPNGSTTFTDLTSEDHVVELVGSSVESNCSIVLAEDEENPRTVTVEPDSTVTTGFSVDCLNAVGTLEVTTETTGDDVDPDGYTVELDEGSGGAIGIDTTETFTGIPEGTRTVTLAGVAGNCDVQDNDQAVPVAFEDTASVTFQVDCDPTEGSIEVTTETTGDDQDPDGYTVQVDEGSGGAIGINATETFTGIPEGTRTVSLAGVAGNCDVQGGSQDVQVAFDSTSTVDFTVECDDIPGDLQVDANTTGDDQDGDGYTVTVVSADGTPSQTVGPNGTVTFTDLTSESHDVQIDESTVADNCTVDSQITQTVTVPEGGTATVTFDVSCDPAEGSIEVTTETTGDDQDPDGYTVQVDEGSGGAIGINATETFTGIPEGTRTVSLAGVATNCTVQNDDQQVQVDFDATTALTFDVSCTAME